MGSLVRNWWMILIRGLLAMLLGLAVLSWAHVSLWRILVLFGGYAILDGLWAIASAVRASPGVPAREAWPVTAEGIASLGIGILALSWPFVAHGTVLFIAAWGIVTGALELLMALRVPDRTGRWLFFTAGCSSCFLAGLILILPHSEAGAVASLLGVFSLAFGLVVALAAITFRRRHSAVRPGAVAVPTPRR